MNDPIRQWRTRLRLTWLSGGAALILCAVWARPPRESPPSQEVTNLALPNHNETTSGPANDEPLENPLDQNLFTANLWNPPPTQGDSAQELAKKNQLASQNAPLRLQLIGITFENGSYHAALYDPDHDRLLIVKDGDRISRYTVTAIVEDGVELESGGQTHKLALRNTSSINSRRQSS